MHEAPAVEPVPFRRLVPWSAVGVALLLLAYLVVFEQGAAASTGALLHELTHDGRHLLGVPCH
jgi:cobalt transporter subunit CbtB